MEAKKRLAATVVGRFHSAATAAVAQRGFEERFQERHLDVGTLAEFRVSGAGPTVWLPGLMRDAGLVKSNSEARRLITQGAVRVNGAATATEEVDRPGRDPIVLEVGKRRAVRIVFD